MIEDELNAIRAAQKPHHPQITPQDWKGIVDTVLFQRELRPVERGYCTLLPDHKRIDKAHPLFQRFRIWQEVVNLRVAPPNQESRSLTTEERERLVGNLLESKDHTFGQIVAFLGLPEGTRINMSSNREKIDGDQTGVKLRNAKCFGKAGWATLSLDDQQDLVEGLIEKTDHQQLVTWLEKRFGLGEEAATHVASARLPLGTGHLSKVTIERLLPHLSAGLRYNEAVEAAGLGHHSNRHASGNEDKLPYYGTVLSQAVGGDPAGYSKPEQHGRLANPRVHIALGQVRKLFNAIVDEHGKPYEVVVELARELKQNEQQRREDKKSQKENRERNERLRSAAFDAGHSNLSGKDMGRLRLWDEQGKPNERICPFTGESLSIESVLSPETEVDHLLPGCRSLDISMNNKVVVMAAANQEKGKRTPFEAWGHDNERYDAIVARARLLPAEKEWRFKENAMERLEQDDRFLDRQLNEHRYLSRLVSDYLEVAVPHNRIWVTPGRMTAKLRRDWGLDSILSGSGEARKNRKDHRHHMVDAAVVGMTSRSLLRNIATASGRDECLENIATAELPWQGYRSDVSELVNRCVVRHRPNHFTALKDKETLRLAGRDVTSGALHNDTAYGIVRDSEGKPKRDENGKFILIETKSLDSLTEKRLDDVRDRKLRDELKDLWSQIKADNPGNSEQSVQKTFAEEALKQLNVRRVRVFLRLRGRAGR